MSRFCQAIFCAASAAMVFSSSAQISVATPDNSFSDQTNLIPPVPSLTLASPVAFFRQLLVMPPHERMMALKNRPPESRARIVAKIHEYLALDPDERELRLRATELRWYLTPFFKITSSADRDARLALVPEDFRGLVKSRLEQWDILPPDLKKEFLDNDQTLHYFARIEPTNTMAATPAQQKLADQFNQFFELTPAEKARALNTLSEPERLAMEKTLQSFEQLPPSQRFQCIHNYAKFAGMNGAERAEFLKNAEKWSQMSPAERQSWRDLVANVPVMPPMPDAAPPNFPPNLIPHPNAPKNSRVNMATN